MESVLTFCDKAAADGTLVGSGPGIAGKLRLRALRTELLLAKAFLEQGYEGSAVVILRGAHALCDGKTRPTDLVQGPATPELASLLEALINDWNGA